MTPDCAAANVVALWQGLLGETVVEVAEEQAALEKDSREGVRSLYQRWMGGEEIMVYPNDFGSLGD